MISKIFHCKYFTGRSLENTKSLRVGNFMIRILLTIYLFIGSAVTASEIRWIQVETLPSIVRAKEATSRFSTILSENVNIFSLDDGWYAVSLGPYDPTKAFEILNTKLDAQLISPDSFVTDGKNYGEKVWTAGSFDMADLEKLSNNGNAEYDQNYTFDLNKDSLDPSQGNNLLFSSLEELEPLEKAQFFESKLSDFYKKAVQSALFADGVYDSEIDGQYGPGTRKAINEWQIKNAYEATGFLTMSQQSELIKNYLKPLLENGLKVEKNILAGIKIPMLNIFKKPVKINPPIITYEAEPASKIKVFLISQHGDEYDLKILFNAMKDLEIIPSDGKKVLFRNSFELSGKNNQLESFFTAVSSNNKVKGFGLQWPVEEDYIAKRLLVKMRLEFESIPGALRERRDANEDRNLNKYLGFELRRPTYSRSGLFIDEEAKIITQSSGLLNCPNITVNGIHKYKIVAENRGLDLALLAPQQVLKPLSFIEYTTTVPKIGEQVVLSSFPYQGKLNRSTLTEGTIRELEDLRGDTRKFRISIPVNPGDSGGGLFDLSGNFIGLHLAEPSTINLDAQIVLKAREITKFLGEVGLSELKRSYRAEPLDLRQIDSMANRVTALISCWEQY